MPDLSGAVQLDAYVDWECGNCGKETRTGPRPPNAAVMHVCPSLHYLSAPMTRAGTAAKVWAQEREDYQGAELTQDGDNGVPYMAIVRTRPEGQDVWVLPPCAQLYGSGGS